MYIKFLALTKYSTNDCCCFWRVRHIKELGEREWERGWAWLFLPAFLAAWVNCGCHKEATGTQGEASLFHEFLITSCCSLLSSEQKNSSHGWQTSGPVHWAYSSNLTVTLLSLPEWSRDSFSALDCRCWWARSTIWGNMGCNPFKLSQCQQSQHSAKCQSPMESSESSCTFQMCALTVCQAVPKARGMLSPKAWWPGAKVWDVISGSKQLGKWSMNPTIKRNASLLASCLANDTTSLVKHLSSRVTHPSRDWYGQPGWPSYGQ